ncbi:hypothetical protein BH11MYX4_BH11MYX4_01960 [soil metagenome]
MQYASGHDPPSGQQETVLLSEPGLQVTTARLVVGYLTYPIASITSVTPFTVTANMRVPNAAVVLGLVVNLAALGAIRMGTENKGGWLFVVAMIGSIAFFWGLYQVRTRQTVHGISVATSGTEVRAFHSPDLARVHRVLGALNQAIGSR